MCCALKKYRTRRAPKAACKTGDHRLIWLDREYKEIVIVVSVVLIYSVCP